LTDEGHDGFDGWSARVAIAEVRALGGVEHEPLVEVGLQRLDAVAGLLAHLHPEELVVDRAVETLDEAVGLWASDLGAAVLDAVEVEIELVGVLVGPAELPAVVGQHGFHRQVESAAEGQHVIAS
jgi:hypothetical protein